MRFCQSHWGELRTAIEERGLTPFVARNGEEAADRTEDNLRRGGTTADNFDPLMNANWAIMANALEAGGLYLMAGDYCPLCELAKNVGPDMPAKWVCYAADEQLDRARNLGLVSKQ